MHLKRDQINQIISKLKDYKGSNNMITKDKLEKGLLDYYVRRHD